MMVAAQLERHFKQTKATNKPFVTISREFGCDAKQLAEQIIERLQAGNKDPEVPWIIFGKTRLLDVISQVQLSQDTVRMLEDYGDSSFASYIQEQLFGHKAQLTTIKKIGKLLHIMAERGNVVLVGSGASVLTRSLASGIHVRLYASLEWRCANYQSRWKLDKAAAHSEVLEKQEKREGFVKTYLGDDVANPSLYHLLINNERMDTRRIADLLAAMLSGS